MCQIVPILEVDYGESTLDNVVYKESYKAIVRSNDEHGEYYRYCINNRYPDRVGERLIAHCKPCSGGSIAADVCYFDSWLECVIPMTNGDSFLVYLYREVKNGSHSNMECVRLKDSVRSPKVKPKTGTTTEKITKESGEFRDANSSIFTDAVDV